MWDSADQYLEDKSKLWKKGDQLMEEIKTNPKYKDLLDIIPFIEDVKGDRAFYERQESKYFKECNRAEFERDIYKNYAHALQTIVRISNQRRVEQLRKLYRVNEIEEER